MLSLGFARLLKNKTDSTLIQLLRYAFVGGLAFVVDFCTLYALTEYARIYYMHSAALAFLVGLTTNYLISIVWVFQKRTFENRLAEYGIFGLLGVLGLGLNQLLIYVLTEHVGCHYLFSKATATALVFLWNFGSRKLVLFHYVPAPTASAGRATAGGPADSAPAEAPQLGAAFLMTSPATTTTSTATY